MPLLHRPPDDFSAPSPFIREWVARLAREQPHGRALDVAMGHGRHARLLAASGFTTFGVDLDWQAIASTKARLAPDGLRVLGWSADLRSATLPEAFFDVIVVTRYLQRDLFGALARALAAGGTLLYETFTEAQRLKGRGPTSPDHLLHPEELRELAASLTLLDYEEIDGPEAVARLAARRPRK